MRCVICDKSDDLITFDNKRGEFTPCGECQNAITDCLDGYNHADAVLEALLVDED